MGMPRPQIRLETHREGCFLNALVNLKQMRMSGADAHPNNFYQPFGRKRSHSFNRKEECAKFNRFEFFMQDQFDLWSYIREETKRQVELIRFRPAHARNAGIKITEKFSNR